MYDLAAILRVYQGSNGDATKALYAALEEKGAMGIIAMNLFRATKCSERAKEYRGARYRGAAYDRKQWSIDNLCAALEANAATTAMSWGWGIDSEQPVHSHVLYIDLPTGQVSFHSGARGSGPDYPGSWDGIRERGVDRICRWIARLFKSEPASEAIT